MEKLYPLRFEPIFQYRLWGGRKLEALSRDGLPGDGPIGEAWIMSDRDDFPSKVANGALAGKKIHELLTASPDGMLGRLSGRYERFPLLLKYLDAKEMLSVQVHPSDRQKEFLPPGENGKTEAWVVLESEPDSFIFAGLKPGTTADDLRHLDGENAGNSLAGFNPKPGEGVFIEAGTVHALGGGVVVFEVQQNSDVTFRLFDWDRVDAKTGKTRDLHIEQSIACTDFSQGPVGPVDPVKEASTPVMRERFFQSAHFTLWENRGDVPFLIGAPKLPRTVICIEGSGEIRHGGEIYAVVKGDVWFLPAEVGIAEFVPQGSVAVLEVALPE